MIELKVVDLKNSKNAQEICNILNRDYTDVPEKADVEKIQNGKVIYLWAYRGDEKVGITGFYYITKTLVETVKTVVFNEFRGQGVGSKISQAVEGYCINLGVHKIRSTIYAQNVAMISIKLKQGYQIEGYHPDHEAIGFHEYSLGKIIRRK